MTSSPPAFFKYPWRRRQSTTVMASTGCPDSDSVTAAQKTSPKDLLEKSAGRRSSSAVASASSLDRMAVTTAFSASCAASDRMGIAVAVLMVVEGEGGRCGKGFD